MALRTFPKPPHAGIWGETRQRGPWLGRRMTRRNERLPALPVCLLETRAIHGLCSPAAASPSRPAPPLSLPSLAFGPEPLGKRAGRHAAPAVRRQRHWPVLSARLGASVFSALRILRGCLELTQREPLGIGGARLPAVLHGRSYVCVCVSTYLVGFALFCRARWGKEIGWREGKGRAAKRHGGVPAVSLRVLPGRGARTWPESLRDGWLARRGLSPWFPGRRGGGDR